MLEVRGLQVNYSDIIAVRKAEFSVEENEVVSLVGSNGAGKTTVLKTILGLLKPQKGEIRYGEHRLDKLRSDRIVEVGVAHVPEGRGMFPRMSVEENILLGAFIAAAKKETQGVDGKSVFALSEIKRAQEATGRNAFGRGAADACHRSRFDGASETLDAG